MRQEEYFEEDSKMSVVQSKSKTLANPQRGDLQTSAVESLKQLLAETKDKNKKKKLRKKLKKLQEKRWVFCFVVGHFKEGRRNITVNKMC